MLNAVSVRDGKATLYKFRCEADCLKWCDDNRNERRPITVQEFEDFASLSQGHWQREFVRGGPRAYRPEEAIIGWRWIWALGEG